MSRTATRTVGVDRFGRTETTVILSGDGARLRVDYARRSDAPFGTHAGSVRLVAQPPFPCGPEEVDDDTDVVVGISHVPEQFQYRASEYGLAPEVRANRERYLQTLLTTGAAGDHALPHLVLVPPTPGREKWGVASLMVRPANVMDAIDWAQGTLPGTRPRIDVRMVAAVRAFMLLGEIPADGPVVFSHIDLFESIHVLVHQQAPVRWATMPSGLVQLAQRAAAQTQRSIADVLESAWTGAGDPALEEEYRNQLDRVLQQMRNSLRQSVPEGQPEPPLKRIVISGPAAQIPAFLGIQFQAAPKVPVEPFFPAIRLAGATDEMRENPGDFTVALGLALNPPVEMQDSERLGLDCTRGISLDLLPAERRAPWTIEQYRTGATTRSGRRPATTTAKSSTLLPLLLRARPVFYALTLVVTAMIAYRWLAITRVQRQITSLRADSLQIAQTLMAVQNLAQIQQDLAEKRAALTRMTDARAHATQVLQATGDAMGASSPSVWLTQLSVTGTSAMQYRGVAITPSAAASYVDALAHLPGAHGVTLEGLTPTGPTANGSRPAVGYAFTISVELPALTTMPLPPPPGLPGPGVTH